MIAAIYARKSTEQNGVTDEEKSVTRQVEHAKAYAERKGWTVAEAHVYIDDGISGAEFEERRPALMRLMNALKPRPPFQVLLVSDRDRIGREQIETSYILKQIIRASVQVIECKGPEGREITLSSATDKVIMAVEDFAAEVEREKARQRTYDAMARKARAGHVTGGRVFGYDNRDVLDAEGRRLHVERTVNPTEAAIVRELFALAATGQGARRIAQAFNARGVLAPLPRRAGRRRSWAPSTVREMLGRPLYRGEVVWNQSRKRNMGASTGRRAGTPGPGSVSRPRRSGSSRSRSGATSRPGSARPGMSTSGGRTGNCTGARRTGPSQSIS